VLFSILKITLGCPTGNKCFIFVVRILCTGKLKKIIDNDGFTIFEYCFVISIVRNAIDFIGTWIIENC
jgi:hypothetical protein